MIGSALVLISKTDFWLKLGHSALDRASVFGWISKEKKRGSPPTPCHFRQAADLPKMTRNRW